MVEKTDEKPTQNMMGFDDYCYEHLSSVKEEIKNKLNTAVSFSDAYREVAKIFNKNKKEFDDNLKEEAKKLGIKEDKK